MSTPLLGIRHNDRNTFIRYLSRIRILAVSTPYITRFAWMISSFHLSPDTTSEHSENSWPVTIFYDLSSSKLYIIKSLYCTGAQMQWASASDTVTFASVTLPCRKEVQIHVWIILKWALSFPFFQRLQICTVSGFSFRITGRFLYTNTVYISSLQWNGKTCSF